MKVSRATRAQLARQAARIRADQQRHGAPVPAIAAEIIRRLPLAPLEAWRLAYGWSRPDVVEAVCQIYRADGLAPPGLSTAMLCRWEHGPTRPGLDYIHALARVYQTSPAQLGFVSPPTVAGWYGHLTPPPRQEHPMAAQYPDLSAVADSIAAHGPGAGVLDLAQHALDFYTQRYSHYPPRALAAEVARCRSLLIGHGDTHTEARRIIGWLSALLGNLAHHTNDGAGALIHLSTAARIGADIGHAHLSGWALGAQAMVAHAQHRPGPALELADQAAQYAHTPLHQAQIIAWCRLRPLAALGRTEELATATHQARRHMDAAHDQPGRFGFDQAEFHLHLAESHLLANDAGAAAEHARTSAAHKRAGSPGWAAATVVCARAHAAQRQGQDAVALALGVLDAVPAVQMRATTRARLAALVRDLDGYGGAHALRERIHGQGPV